MITPELWGVINLTTDSFYARSRASVEVGVRLAGTMIADGAAAIDAGAESTRPGAEEIPADRQLDILLPFIAACAEKYGAAFVKKISIDTRSATVMHAVIGKGVGLINDVSGGSEAIYRLIAETGVKYVLMHTQGTPQTMQNSPGYGDVVTEVGRYFLERTERLLGSGVTPKQIIWDTGIGFGKTVEHNLALIAAHPRLRRHGYPILAGVSRKSFIGKILGAERPEERLAGTLAVQSYLTLHGHGCDILRVHDVKEMADTLKVFNALKPYEL